MKNMLKYAKKILSFAFGSIITTSIISIIFSLIKDTEILASLLNANIIVGTVIIVVGIFGFMFPISLKKFIKKDPLKDHSTIVDMVRDEKDAKLTDSVINIFWGVSHIVIVGILEVIIKSIQ